MMQERDLQELAALASEKTPLLSLYLNMDPHRRSADDYKLSLRRLLAEAADQNAEPADIDRIERFFYHEYSWQGRGVACFSHQARGFWRVYPLLVPVEDLVYVGLRPYIKPLTDIWDEYQRLGVVAVDREGARLFVYHLGALEDSAGTLGNEVKRHKQGGWSAQRYQRHEDEEAKHNLKDAVEWADGYLRQHKVTRLVLGGTDENLARFRELMPHTLQEKVIGQVNLDTNASPGEVWELCFEVAQEAKRKAETTLLEQVITAAHKGGAGVTGVSETLAALQAGRVYHLLVGKNHHVAGGQCSHCGAIMAEQPDTCPYCGQVVIPVRDAIDMAVQHALESGLRVSILDVSPALEQSGGMAAVLRY